MFKALINGELSTQTSAFDRGLLYGQSVFETVAILNGKACLLDDHLARLEKGCLALGIPYESAQLRANIDALLNGEKKAVLRITVTMGEGGRGYLNPSERSPTRILSLHEYPEHPKHYWEKGVTIGAADIRLARQPALAGIKHGNRLEQIIARSQWQPDWQEALLMDQEGEVIEATQSNIFVRKGDTLLTPCLKNAGVAGVMRQYVIELATKLGMTVEIVSLSMADIDAADELFLSNSVIGIWPVNHFGNTAYPTLETSHKLLKLIIKNEVIPHY